MCSATSWSRRAACPRRQPSRNRSWCRWWLHSRYRFLYQSPLHPPCCSYDSRRPPLDGYYHCPCSLTYRYFRCSSKFDVHSSPLDSSNRPSVCSAKKSRCLNKYQWYSRTVSATNTAILLEAYSSGSLSDNLVGYKLRNLFTLSKRCRLAIETLTRWIWELARFRVLVYCFSI